MKESRLTKPMKGHFEKNNLPPVKFLKEVASWWTMRTKPAMASRLATRCWWTCSTATKFVDIVGNQQGTRICGRGEAPPVCRRRSVARLDVPDHGSIGSSAFPSRVFKGMRMAGHMGDERVTTRNLRILGIDRDENLLVVEGAVPGAKTATC